MILTTTRDVMQNHTKSQMRFHSSWLSEEEAGGSASEIGRAAIPSAIRKRKIETSSNPSTLKCNPGPSCHSVTAAQDILCAPTRGGSRRGKDGSLARAYCTT